MLAALAAQTERLEQAAAVLRAQIRALQAEREHIAEVLSDSFLAP
jgi:cell division protein FtsB